MAIYLLVNGLSLMDPYETTSKSVEGAQMAPELPLAYLSGTVF